MGRWRNQWVVMEAAVRHAAQAARKDADASQSLRDIGYAYGLQRAVDLIEEFRASMPPTELEAMLDSLEHDFPD